MSDREGSASATKEESVNLPRITGLPFIRRSTAVRRRRGRSLSGDHASRGDGSEGEDGDERELHVDIVIWELGCWILGQSESSGRVIEGNLRSISWISEIEKMCSGLRPSWERGRTYILYQYAYYFRLPHHSNTKRESTARSPRLL